MELLISLSESLSLSIQISPWAPVLSVMASENEGDFWLLSSTLFSLLSNPHSNDIGKCTSVIEILKYCQSELPSSFQDLLLSFLPSLVNLSQTSADSLYGQELATLTQCAFQYDSISRIHALVLHPHSIVHSIVQEQLQKEKDWKHRRDTNSVSRRDVSGAIESDAEAKSTLLAPSTHSLSPDEQMALDVTLLKKMLSEVRRMTILSELQNGDAPQANTTKHHDTSSSNRHPGTSKVGNHSLFPMPVVFDSPFLTQASSGLSRWVPLLLAGLNRLSNPASSSSRMNIDVEQPMLGSSSSFAQLPVDVVKLVFSLLQVENGEKHCLSLLLNLNLLNSSTVSSYEDRKALETVCIKLVEYLHLLRINDPLRPYIPSISAKGPFCEATQENEDNYSHKSIAERVFGSGFPRRLSLSSHASRLDQPKNPAEDDHFNIPRSSLPPHSTYAPLCSQSESQVAMRVENLLTWIVQQMLLGTTSMLECAGLDQVKEKLIAVLESTFLLPHLQTLLLFGPHISPDIPFTDDELHWISELSSPSNALKRAFWKRFLQSPSHPSSRLLLSKISTFRIYGHDTTDLATPISSDASEIVRHISNWFKFFALSVVAFNLSFSLESIMSIRYLAVQLLDLQHRVAPDAMHFVESAFQYAFVSLACFALSPAQTSAENFSCFVHLYQTLVQLSNPEVKWSCYSSSLLRLFQQLHHLQRCDLLAQVIQRVLQVPVNQPWLVKGLTTTFQATPQVLDSTTSPMASTPFEGHNSFPPSNYTTPRSRSTQTTRKSLMHVSISDAWLWSSSPALLSHLCLESLSEPIPSIAHSYEPSSSLITIFEEADLLSSSFSASTRRTSQQLIPSKSNHGGITQDIAKTPPNIKKRAGDWKTCADPWLSWIILRLLLHINPNADFRRFTPNIVNGHMVSSTWVGGNHDGVAQSLWRMFERLSEYVCTDLPTHVKGIHVIVLDTLQSFTDLVLQGEQRFWDVERIASSLSSTRSANFIISLTIPHHDGEEQTICRLTPENILQELVFVSVAFCKSPLARQSSVISPSTTPFLPTFTDETSSFSGSRGNATMMVDGDVDDVSMKKTDFMSYIARDGSVSTMSAMSVHVPSQERKRLHLQLLNATVLARDCVAHASKLLQLSKVLYVEVPNVIDSSSSSMPMFNRCPGRSCFIPLFEIIKKRALSAFAHIRHFFDILFLNSKSQSSPISTSRSIAVQVDFLGGDYRSLVADQPFLSSVNFASLQSHVVLERFLVDSIHELSQSKSAHWKEKCLTGMLNWIMKSVSLERCLQTCAFAILDDTQQLSSDQQKRSTSESIDLVHNRLLDNPSMLFNFRLPLLHHPTFFNFMFYKLISYYFSLSKIEIYRIMRSSEQQDATSIQEHHDTDSDELDEDGSQASSDYRLPIPRASSSTLQSKATQSSMMMATSTSDESASSSSTDASSASQPPVVASHLTDPFHLRSMHKNSSRNMSMIGGGSLKSGEKKMSLQDVELLKRLQDVVLVQMLIDLMLFVEEEGQERALDLKLEQAVREQLRVSICVFLQQMFVNDGQLMSLVHQQGYPARVLPWLMSGVPSMHYCLEIVPPLLAQSFQRFTVSDIDVQAITFPIKVASSAISRYPTQRSLELATYIFELYRSAGKSLNKSIWLSTLSDLSQLTTTFPSLNLHLVELVALHEPTMTATTTTTSSSSTVGVLETIISSSPSPSPGTGETRSSYPSSSSFSSTSSSSSQHRSNENAGRATLRASFAHLLKGSASAPFLKG